MAQLIETISAACIILTILCPVNDCLKYNSSETSQFRRSLDDEQFCKLTDSCVVDNVTPQSITVRWPCCTGTTVEVTSRPLVTRSRACSCDRKYGEQTQSSLTSDCVAIFNNYCPYNDYEITLTAGDESCSVIQTTLPNVPTWSSRREVFEEKVRLSWTDTYCSDNKRPIYRIFYSDSDNVERIEDTLDKSLLLQYLLPKTTYTIKLCACDNHNHRNDEKFCSQNTTIKITTKPGVPSEPRDLKATAINSTAIQLTWNVPAEPRGYIDGYNITCRKGFLVVQKTVLFGNITTTFTVPMLQVWTQYTCSVQAFNSDNGRPLTSRESKANIVTSPEHPSEPLRLKVEDIKFNELLLSWERPTRPRGPIDGYFVGFNKDLEEDFAVVSPTSLNCRIQHLNPGTIYTLTVFAFNYDTDGEGHPVENWFLNGSEATVSSKTRPAAPGAPRDVRIVDVTSDKMLLKWKRPSAPGGPIDGYVIELITDESQTVLSGSALFHHLNDLSPDTNYTIALFAFNMDENKRLYGEEILINFSTKPKELSNAEILEKLSETNRILNKTLELSNAKFLKKMVVQMSETNRLLNKTLQTLEEHYGREHRTRLDHE